MSFGISWTNPDGQLAFSDAARRVTFQRKVTGSHTPTGNNGFFSIPTGETNALLPPVVFTEVVTGLLPGEGAAPLDLEWSGTQWLLNCGAEALGGTRSVTAYIFNLDLGVATGSDWGIETYNSNSEVSFTTKGEKQLFAVAKVNLIRGPDSALGGNPTIGTASATLPASATGLAKLSTNIMACIRGDARRIQIPQSGQFNIARMTTPIVRSNASSNTIETDNSVYFVQTGTGFSYHSVLWKQKWAICIDGDLYS